LKVCTYFDSGYQSRGTALFSSIESGELAERAILLLDDFVSTKAVPNSETWRLPAFLASHELIARIISARSRAEKMFSVGPSFLLEQMSSLAVDEWLVYVDADLFFFRPLDQYLEHFVGSNVIIAPHSHFAWNRKRLAKYGEFNVGLVAFRNNKEGLAALKYWAESCLVWCSDVPEDGKYADQKYLENFAKVSSGVAIDCRKGANLAPWNLGFSKLSLDANDKLMVDGEPVYYFHAQGITRTKSAWILGHLPYLSLASRSAKKFIYKPYLAALLKSEEENPDAQASSSRSPEGAPRPVMLLFGKILQFVLGQVIFDSQLRKLSSDTD
jgi:hypothetical protein